MAVHAPPDLLPAARGALERGRDRLLADQDPGGWWWAELESNATIVAEHVFLITMLGIARDDDLRRLANDLRARQGEDGGWPLWFDGPSDLSTTVEAYYALRLAGAPADDPALVRARERVLALGGADRARFFTKLWLAVQGRYPWTALPVIPPEMIMLPPRAPLSPYRFACWARGTFVALMVVLSRHPTYPQPVGLDELFVAPPGAGPAPRAKAAGRVDALVPPRDAAGARLQPAPAAAPARPRRGPHRPLDLRPAGGRRLVGRHPAAVGLLDHRAARARLPPRPPGDRQGPRGLRRRVPGGGRRAPRVQACQSPVWDTALAAIALGDAGLPADHPALVRAADWLLAKEVDRSGDWWEIPRRGRPGGWAFEFDNDCYPDIDDTAEVLLALLRARPAARAPGHPARASTGCSACRAATAAGARSTSTTPARHDRSCRSATSAR